MRERQVAVSFIEGPQHIAIVKRLNLKCDGGIVCMKPCDRIRRDFEPERWQDRKTQAAAGSESQILRGLLQGFHPRIELPSLLEQDMGLVSWHQAPFYYAEQNKSYPTLRMTEYFAYGWL